MVYKGFLFPFGHRASLIKSTEGTLSVEFPPPHVAEGAFFRPHNSHKLLNFMEKTQQPSAATLRRQHGGALQTVRCPASPEAYFVLGAQSGPNESVR
jgi:hypothetical protein